MFDLILTLPPVSRAGTVATPPRHVQGRKSFNRGKHTEALTARRLYFSHKLVGM